VIVVVGGFVAASMLSGGGAKTDACEAIAAPAIAAPA
jgi:hypothetical protein